MDKNIKEITFFETKDDLALKQWFSMLGPPGLARGSTRLFLLSCYRLEKNCTGYF
jgi:hypothetical protein